MECRAHAMSCLKQAESESPSGRITLLAISQQWIKLANQMEDSNTLLEVMEHLDRNWEHPLKGNGKAALLVE